MRRLAGSGSTRPRQTGHEGACARARSDVIHEARHGTWKLWPHAAVVGGAPKSASAQIAHSGGAMVAMRSVVQTCAVVWDPRGNQHLL